MIKKYISGALIALSISHMHLFADESAAEDCCCEEVLIGGEMLNPHLINAGYPFSAIIDTCNCWNVYARGDFIYWSSVSNEQGILAHKMTFDQTQIRNFYQSNKYRPGFRVGIGADIGTVLLDLTWVRLHHHGHFPFSTRPNELIQLPGLSRLTGPPVGFSNTDIKLDKNYDLGILSLQQPIYLGSRIIANFNYGIAVVWGEHKWNVNSTALNVAPPPTVFTSNGFSFAHHKAWSLGPNLGFHVTAFLPLGLKAIASFNGSGMYSSLYKGITQHSYPALPQFIAYNTIIRSKKHAPHIQAMQTGEIGLGWGSYLYCDKFYLDLSVTYAFFYQGSTIFGIPINAHASDLTNLESYGMQGITVGGRINF